MDLLKINVPTLREILKLSERREEILRELQKLEEEILSYQGNSLPNSPSKLRAQQKKESHFKVTSNNDQKAKRKRLARGEMKSQILSALQEAGAEGIKIPDLAQKIGLKSANLHVWFSNVGKKLPEIERLAAGLFRLRS